MKARKPIYKALIEAQLDLLEASSIEELYEKAVKCACKLSGAKTGSFYIMDYLNENDFRFIRTYSNSGPMYGYVPRKNGPLSYALRKQKPHIVPAEEMYSYRPEFIGSGLKCIIFLPIHYKDLTIGVMSLRYYKKRKPRQEMLDFLHLFGSFLSLVFYNLQLMVDVKQALETRDLFIALAGHELRTPLTSVTTFAHLIKQKVQKNTLPSLKLIEQHLEQLGHLKRLINELLDVNHIAKGMLTYDKRPVCLRSLIEKIATNFKAIYPHRILETELELKRDLEIQADEDKLIQAIINLLNNAVKYSPTETPITLRVEEKDESVIIAVTDKGSGISKEALPHVFDRFYREQPKSQTSGLGLGLYLVKQIITEHKGIIHVSSQVGVGTTFTVILPI